MCHLVEVGEAREDSRFDELQALRATLILKDLIFLNVSFGLFFVPSLVPVDSLHKLLVKMELKSLFLFLPLEF